jgi:hypothetical protein
MAHRGTALAVAAACAVAAGCTDPAVEPPDAVDAARLAAVRADPALAGATVRESTTGTGSGNASWLRAQVLLTTEAPASARAAQVRRTGWRVTYVACRDPAGTPGPATTVQAFRTMPAPDAGGGAYTVGLRIEDGRATAVVPYHLDPADPFGAPPGDVPAGDSCAEQPLRAADGDEAAGREVRIGVQGPAGGG